MTEALQAEVAEQEVENNNGSSNHGEAVDVTTGTANDTPARDYEKEARDMGWMPEAEFKGDKSKWKPADKFVEDGEKILPIVRSQLKREKDERAKQEADFAKRIERMEKTSTAAMERMKAQHTAELERIQTAKLDAVAAGDTVEYKLLDKQEKELSKQTFDAPADDKPESVLAEWESRNDWYTKDFELQDVATRYSQFLAKQNPNITLADNLAKTEAYMREKHPDKFGGKKPAANGHAAVDGGSSFPGAFRKAGKTAADLPAEAKAAGEKYVSQGLFKDLNAYAKEYFSDAN